MSHPEFRMNKQTLKSTTGWWHFDYCSLKGYKYPEGSSAGHNYVMAVADGPTIIDAKFTDVVSSEEVADWSLALAEKHGIPEVIVMDNGAPLHAQVVQDVIAKMGTTIDYIPHSRPKLKGTVERAMGKFLAEELNLRSRSGNA